MAQSITCTSGIGRSARASRSLTTVPVACASSSAAVVVAWTGYDPVTRWYGQDAPTLYRSLRSLASLPAKIFRRRVQRGPREIGHSWPYVRGDVASGAEIHQHEAAAALAHDIRRP